MQENQMPNNSESNNFDNKRLDNDKRDQGTNLDERTGMNGHNKNNEENDLNSNNASEENNSLNDSFNNQNSKEQKIEQKYDASAIRVLEGLEAVRKRPGMYIGSTGPRGLHHLVYEVVDNSIDEALAGFCDKIIVTLEDDNFVRVEDNGRGIPTEIHPQYNKPALEIVMTKLHAGGKFDKKAYKVSGGLHGVGISVVNALSEILEVWVKRNGKIHYMKFSRGKVIEPMTIIGDTNETGTIVRFKPDAEIFETIVFDFDTLATRLKELAYLNPQITLILEDKRKGKEKRREFHFEGGIKQFVEDIVKDKKIHEPIYISGKKDDIIVETAFVYTDSYKTNLISFVNNINTVEGGTHVVGFKSALTKVIKKFIIDSKINIESSDIIEGVTGIISIKHPEPQFEGQTKAKLGNTDARFAVDSIVTKQLQEFLEMRPNITKRIVDKIITSAKARIAAKKAKELVRRKSALTNLALPGKLADCTTKDVNKAELFLVEGDSAGGNAKMARNKEFQAILPLRGKILNVEKANMHKMLNNEEIKAIITAIGTGIGKDFDISKLRYGKIIIMTDADVDGSHIATLLLTLFFRLMPQLIEEGHVYRALPPLYKIKSRREVYYAYNDKEKEDIVKQLEMENKPYDVQRYKGLGEMNADELWETTMNPETRRLKQITIEDAIEADQTFTLLMGSEVEPRRQFIIEHALEVKNLDI